MTAEVAQVDFKDETRPHVAVWKVEDLLSRLQIRIPDYQRPYTWSSRNVAELVDDIEQFTKNGDYRIGTVILHRREDENGAEILDVVDGQQRVTTLHVLARVLQATGSDPGPRVVAQLQLSPYDAEITAQRLRENHDFLQRLVGEWDADRVRSFADAMFVRCEAIVVILTNLDEAFQMFDSQNARGRALYPTDLLKAFHLREIGGGEHEAATRREVVELWEDIPSAHVNALFSEYLFKIRRWSAGRAVEKEGFTAKHVRMFKGIRERDVDNVENNWSRAFIYAKNYTDDFRRENATVVRFGLMGTVEYPHQIDHPVINGETFFRMVSHYYDLGVRLGLHAFDDDHLTQRSRLGASRSSAATPIDERSRPGGDASRYAYIRGLLDALLLYYHDRFGDQESERFAALAARFAMVPRAESFAVKRETVNKHALGTLPQSPNLFQEIREASSAREVVSLTIRRPTLYDRGSRGPNVTDRAVVESLWPSSNEPGEL